MADPLDGVAADRGGAVKHRAIHCTLWIVGLLVIIGARAADPVSVRTEVGYLLGAIEAADCAFYRNGQWYDAHAAAAHLSHKYELLTATGQIQTAEDFIDKAATRSSFSGVTYQVRCGSAAPQLSAEWLRAILSQHRALAPPGAAQALMLDR